MIDEPIQVVSYDSNWPLLFESEKEKILKAIITADIIVEHFGSTAVEGMKAKPIIDILIGYDSPGTPEQIKLGLSSLGYEFLGDAGIPGRLAFRKRGMLNFNIAAFNSSSMLFRNNIAIREYLRNCKEACLEYSQLKEKSIANGYTSLLKYSEQKYEFVKSLESSANDFLEAKKCP